MTTTKLEIRKRDGTTLLFYELWDGETAVSVMNLESAKRMAFRRALELITNDKADRVEVLAPDSPPDIWDRARLDAMDVEWERQNQENKARVREIYGHDGYGGI